VNSRWLPGGYRTISRLTICDHPARAASSLREFEILRQLATPRPGRSLRTRAGPQSNDVVLQRGQDRRPLRFACLPAPHSPASQDDDQALRCCDIGGRGFAAPTSSANPHRFSLMSAGQAAGLPASLAPAAPVVDAPGPMPRHCLTSVRTLVVPRCNSGRGVTVATRNRDGVNTVLTTTSPQGRSCNPSRAAPHRARGRALPVRRTPSRLATWPTSRCGRRIVRDARPTRRDLRAAAGRRAIRDGEGRLPGRRRGVGGAGRARRLKRLATGQRSRHMWRCSMSSSRNGSPSSTKPARP